MNEKRMLFKVLLCFCFLQIMVSACCHQSGSWKNIANNKCIRAKGNHYKEFTYNGPSTFIIAMKMVHKSGRIGCHGSAHTHWGCDNNAPINIIVTDERNKRIYPSPLVKIRNGGWYDLPGYNWNSQELVFSDTGFQYLYKGQKLRIWYGEDLYNYTEWDNHGYTCMDVYVYYPDF